MLIAVDALLVAPPFSGVQHAILHMLRELLTLESPHRFAVLAAADVDIAAAIGDVPRPYTVLRAPLRAGQRVQRALWQQLGMHKLLAEEGVELLYAPGYLTSLRWDGPSVVFVHDTIALSHPQLCKRSNALNYRLLLPPSARKATRVAVPSHASADDVVRYCRVPATRVRVVPLGVVLPEQPTPEQVAAVRARLGVGDAPYLLAVSVIEPKKNFGNLIRWFGAWRASGLPHHLVIAGHWGWRTSEVRRALGASRYRAFIHLPGYLPQGELPALMAGAALQLMPSRYEGFGLPALEAMAVGTPVVVSDRGALPETVGPAGLVVPLEGVLWRAEIPTLLRHPERLDAMRMAGREWATAHPWHHTGERLLQLFEEAEASYQP
jgi:glycosyltransferase involved in cell wall biosynthesis